MGARHAATAGEVVASIVGQGAAHRSAVVVAVSDAGHIVAEAVSTHSAVVMAATMVPVAMIVMVVMVRMMPTPVVGPVGAVPVGVVVPRIAPVGVGIPGVAPVGIPAPIGSPVGTVAPADINGWVVPIEGVVGVHVDVSVATATGVVVVIIVSRRGGLRAETLDARGEVGIVIGLCGGVHHAVGVGHRFSGLIDGVGIADVILAVGLVGLIVIFRVAADAGAHVGAVAGGHLSARVAVRRIVGVVFGRLAIGRAADEGH